MRQFYRFFVASALVFVVSASASGQKRAAAVSGTMSVEEATALAEGWTFLAQRRIDQAAARAAALLRSNPRSGAALMFAVEVEIARGGPLAGLVQYEHWLGRRTMEEPAVLRRLARATLGEIGAQRQDPAARVEALRALAAEGETRAAEELAEAASQGGSAEKRALAALGDQSAVEALIAEVESAPAALVAAIDALGASRSPLAAAPLVERLEDPRPEVRGAAVAALGKLGDVRLLPRITAMLSDGNMYVRVKAAGALLRLGDKSGLPILQELMADPSPASMLAAAEAMAGAPDESWTALVRELTRAPQAEIRAAAARLIAPHDPELSLEVLQSLAAHENPVIREMASRGLGEVVTSDLTTLRGLMKNSDRLTRVRAAVRIIALTG
ncbi:MAG: HEAT repeat domain-containing protein [Vicinamibacterales bacterium]